MTWLFTDETTPQAEQLLDRAGIERILVPGLWFLEVTNVLATAERKGRIQAADAEQFVAELGRFDIEVDRDSFDRAFTHLPPLCRAHKLTSYDAVYLELAVRSGCPLATLDESLRHAAELLSVPLLGK
jgi:predicted nucleic acid-binding protein